ncbi:alpha-amylase family glycosyl hydrolase [Novosphingobium resinovorum]
MATHWGAQPLGDGRWRFGLWAPDAEEARLEVGGMAMPAQAAGQGWWLFESEATAGDAYRWVIEGTPYPDPAARAQIGDVHGPSMLVDPAAYQWRREWPGRPWHEAVVYELHLGTFTEEGTFAAAVAELPRLADLGVTMIEIMPVAQFEGDRGWGYDGVLPFAPHPAYGTPDEMRALVDAAHSHGIAVMLDVVYNHFGPSGNYLGAWCPHSSTLSVPHRGVQESPSRPRPCANTSSPTPCTGWTNTASTACASTRCTPSRTIPKPISSTNWPRASAPVTSADRSTSSPRTNATSPATSPPMRPTTALGTTTGTMPSTAC